MPGKHADNIRIGVSSCLLGDKVRYNGRDKLNQNVKALCGQFDCVAICPEVAIGMGIPRPPINIVQFESAFHARSLDNPKHDVTEDLVLYADTIHQAMPDLCGYIFKARSPSCGVGSTPFFNSAGNELGKTNGIYSDRIIQIIPNLPVIEESQLEIDAERQHFLDAVKRFAGQ